jgi:transposase
MIAYHPRAKTTVEIRKEIKENKEGLSVREQAKKYNVSVSTIMKW